MDLTENVRQKATMIWNTADLLTGSYKPYEYGNVILPMTVLRRFDSVLEPTKEAVLQVNDSMPDNPMKDLMLKDASGVEFYNTSKYTFQTLLDDPDNIESNFRDYINGFSENVRTIMQKFAFDAEITKMAEKKILYSVIKEYTKAEADLHPSRISNLEMGYIFEEIVRRFSEAANEDSGEHFTPREIVKLLAYLLIAEDEDALSDPNVVRTVCDPACGTGGILSEMMDRVHELNAGATIVPFGSEINDQTFAICQADMLIKGNNIDNIRNANTLTDNPFRENGGFDYLAMNPPFGRPYKQFQKEIKDEAALGSKGRFGPGLPSTDDSQMLFLETALAYMKKPSEGGGRIAIVHNGSPLFKGDAGSGPSEIRRHIIENDMLEAIIGLPKDMFYGTGIETYIWVLSNRKKGTKREGKVQLIDARELYTKRRKSLGDKRNDISDEQVDEIVKTFSDFKESEISKIIPNEELGYIKATVLRPQLNEDGTPVVKKGKPVAAKGFSDTEKIPLNVDTEEYMDKEVRPYVPGAFIDEKKSKVGYTIPFTRYFYKYQQPRALEDIEREFNEIEAHRQARLAIVFGGDD